MSARLRAGMLALLAGLALAPAAAAEPGGKSTLSAAQIQDLGFEQRLGEEVPLAAVFRDEAGKEAPLSAYFGSRPLVLALVYNECPMLCSLVLQGLTGALRAVSTDVGKDFDVLVVSFDPKDTPETARKKKAMTVERYKRATGEAGFHFLTGQPAAIEALTRSVGFSYAFDPGTGQYAHPSGIVVLTPQGKIARYLYGSEFSPRDLGLALSEASEGKVGPLSNKLLLLCYQYDPVKGTYSAKIVNAVRAGGVLTLVALGAFLVASMRRERKKREGALAAKPAARPAHGGTP